MKMFVNQVSIKDLFTTNPSHLVYGRTDGGGDDNSTQSNSQLRYSQIDFPDSQDVSSQNQSSGLSQTVDSPRKKFYQRYMSKGPLFAKESSQTKFQSESVPAKNTYQQQVQFNKAKAKERDDRDLFNSVLSTMKNSAAEVSAAVSAVKDGIKDGISSTENQLSRYLETIQDGMEKYNSEILKALKSREDLNNKISQLQQALSDRNERVEELEKKLFELEDTKQQQILDGLQRTCREEHRATRSEMQKLCDKQQKETKTQAQKVNRNFSEITKQTENVQNWLDNHWDQFDKQLEEKLDKELESQQEEIHKEQEQWKRRIEKVVKRLQNQHRNEIDDVLKQQDKQLRNEREDEQRRVMEMQQQQLLDLLAKHKQDITEFVKDKISCQDEQQRRLLHEAVNNIARHEQQEARVLQKQQQQKCQEELQKIYETELKYLKEKHQKEMRYFLSERQQHPIIVSPHLRSGAAIDKVEFSAPRRKSTMLFSSKNTPANNENNFSTNESPLWEMESLDRSSPYYSNVGNSKGSVSFDKSKTVSRIEAKCAKISDSNNCYSKKSNLDPSVQVTRRSSAQADVSMSVNNPILLSPFMAARSWSARALFSKTSISPVASGSPQVTVNDHPQMRSLESGSEGSQHSGVTARRKKKIGHQKTNTEIVPRSTPVQQKGNKKRKRRSVFGPKSHSSKRKKELKDTFSEPRLQQKKKTFVTPTMTEGRLTNKCSGKEREPLPYVRSTRHNINPSLSSPRSRMMLRNDAKSEVTPHRNAGNKYDESRIIRTCESYSSQELSSDCDRSLESSPSLSVNEVLIKRNNKPDNKSPQGVLSQGAGYFVSQITNIDCYFLSSPKVDDSSTERVQKAISGKQFPLRRNATRRTRSTADVEVANQVSIDSRVPDQQRRLRSDLQKRLRNRTISP